MYTQSHKTKNHLRALLLHTTREQRYFFWFYNIVCNIVVYIFGNIIYNECVNIFRFEIFAFKLLFVAEAMSIRSDVLFIFLYASNTTRTHRHVNTLYLYVEIKQDVIEFMKITK